MTYDITFFPKEPEASWEETLAARAAHVGEPDVAGDNATMRPVFERLADLVVAADPAFQRIDGPGFVGLSDPTVGLELHLFATEISLSVPFVHEATTAELVAHRMETVARIVEQETKYSSYDPQLRSGFLELPEPAADAAKEMLRIARRIDGQRRFRVNRSPRDGD